MAAELTMPTLYVDGFVLIPLMATVPPSGSDEEIRAFIERHHGRSATGQGYSFAIAERGTDRAVGQIGLWLENIRHGRASIGYWVVASQRGRGIAATALRAITEWGFGLPEVARLELYVEPWNTGSWRTAEGAGYEREGLLRGWQEVDGERRDMFMYARLR